VHRNSVLRQIAIGNKPGTVEVDTGKEIRSGSSVIEVVVNREPRLLPEMGGIQSRAIGQAVFLDLPDGKNLVALLASCAHAEYPEYPTVIVERLFRVPFESLPSLTGRRELSANQMPTLVTVDNPSDGKTAHVINPNALEDLLGVRLRSIVLEMTTDAVTPINIDAKLPFLIDEEKKRLQLSSYQVFIPRSSAFLRR
jgi:hypothetical protein